ncbi:MAG: MFS transporter [Clostridia bacterium]
MAPRQPRVFSLFWAASSVSDMGSYIRLLALQVLVVQNLHGNAFDLGMVNAARWLPYLLIELLAGAALDRVDRLRMLVVTDFLLMLLYAAMGLVAYLGHLNIGWLMGMIFLAGGVTLFHDAASQSVVRQLVPGSLLLRANARLEQSGALAQTVGPALAGVLTAAIGAPLAVVCDAVGHLFSGALNSLIKGVHAPERTSPARVGQDVREGLRWLYGHRFLRVLAWNTNLWFLFHAMVITVLVPFALRQLGFSALSLGLVLAAAGLGSLIGTSVSTRAEERWGIGRAIAAARAMYGPSLVLVALAPVSDSHGGSAAARVMVAVGQFLYGVAMGIEGPLEMGYRQAITPAHLQGRTNTTMRATNRTMVVIGAPLGAQSPSLSERVRSYGWPSSAWQWSRPGTSARPCTRRSSRPRLPSTPHPRTAARCEGNPHA